MTPELVAVIVAVVVPVIGSGVWLIRLEGRFHTHEARCAERQKRLDERHAEIEKKLDYIVAKLDARDDQH